MSKTLAAAHGQLASIMYLAIVICSFAGMP
jgi:hypothetical protein